MLRVAALGLVCAGLLASTVACAQTAPPINTSICELAKIGHKMNGHRVRMTAIYTTDLLEHSSLNDPRCQDQFLEPYDSREQKPDPSVEAFNKAVIGNINDLHLRQFAIDVTGTFVWKPSAKSPGRLYINKIWSFKRLHGDWKKMQ